MGAVAPGPRGGREPRRRLVRPGPIVGLVGLAALAVVLGLAAWRGEAPGRSKAGGALPGEQAATERSPTPSPAASGVAPPPAGVSHARAPSRRFGAVAHLLWGDTQTALRDLDALAAAGLGVVRFDVSWRNMEPEPGRIDGLDRLDAVVAAIAERGMRPIVTVIETPAWANGDRGPWTPPEDPASYARFVATLAGRYATVTDIAWEIWNEPNDAAFWEPAPDPRAYAELLAAAASAIRAADPGATVLGGSILYGDAAYLQALYDAGARGTFDGLAVHPYARGRPPGDTTDRYHSFAGALDDLRGVMVANGDAMTPMWITEVGWTTADGLDAATLGRYLAEAVERVADRTDVEVLAAYVMGDAAEPGFALSDGAPGATPLDALREAVSRAGTFRP